MKKLADKSIEIDNTIIYLTLFKLHKSYLLLISDQKDMGIGSVTLASPPLVEGLKSTAASYNLFGVDQKLLSTIISEKTSNILKAPVLLLLFLKIKKNEEGIAKQLMKFLNEILKDIAEKQNN